MATRWRWWRASWARSCTPSATGALTEHLNKRSRALLTRHTAWRSCPLYALDGTPVPEEMDHKARIALRSTQHARL
jgi:hypothetical protein